MLAQTQFYPCTAAKRSAEDTELRFFTILPFY